MDIAIIGSGPAGYAAVKALINEANSDSNTIYLISPKSEGPSFDLNDKDPRSWSAQDYDELHQSLKSQQGVKFPPPRSQFGKLSDYWKTSTSIKLYRSDYLGGLGNFWSTSMFPYAPKDFQDWPIRYEDLKPYYQKVADSVGLAGNSSDFLGRYPDSFVNRPAVKSTPLLDSLIENLQVDRDPSFNLIKGDNQMAVETREHEASSCIYCGGCFYGCSQGSLFRPVSALKELIENQRIRFKEGQVAKVTNESSLVQIHFQDGSLMKFDKVFLGAGAIGTSEILLRSLAIKNRSVYVDDNEMYNFPILYYGKKLDQGYDFPISTKVAGLEPSFDQGHYGELHFAPLPDILFDYYLPKQMTDRFRGLINQFKGRALIAQLYVDCATSSRYALSLDQDDQLRIENVRRHHSDFRAKRMIKALKLNLKNTPFVLPPFPLMKVSSSAHYKGGFSFKNKEQPVDHLGQILPNVHIIDSSLFPNSPSQPLTFTIMANAWRIASQVIGV